GVHAAGTSAGRVARCGWAQRRIQPGGRLVPATDGRPAVSRQRAHAAAPGVARRATPAAQAKRSPPPRSGDDLSQGDGEGAGSAVSGGRRFGGGSAALVEGGAGAGPSGGAGGEGVALVPAEPGGGRSGRHGIRPRTSDGDRLHGGGLLVPGPGKPGA